MAKATIVNTLPMELVETKYGLFPPTYVIPPASREKISTLVVDDGFHLLVIPGTDEKTPPMKIVDSGERIAESIIDDYTRACVAVRGETRPDGSVSKPGLFWVQGEYSTSEIAKAFPEKVKAARANTMAWFESLIKLADDEWQRTRQYKMILDLSRRACNYLNLEREWNFDVHQVTNDRCWACNSIVSPRAIVCGTCRAVLNKDAYAKAKNDFVTGV